MLISFSLCLIRYKIYNRKIEATPLLICLEGLLRYFIKKCERESFIVQVALSHLDWLCERPIR